ncbi:MAG TPA: hypothetical protein VHZ54_19725 [Solirubrobacterales bacterium]|nr:hypothetical protein [Solirubrobacterales bacterium]
MPLLSQLGIVELAVGVLSGWLMVMTLEAPDVLRRMGVRQMGRIRQAHLDLLMQGTILIAVGVAVDPVSTWIGVLLVLGAFLAPPLLGVLALYPDLRERSIAYKAINTVVLLGFSVGWVALAIAAVGR